MSTSLFGKVCCWDNLLLAWKNASKGKRGRATTSDFEHQIADKLLLLKKDLINGDYRPGKYHHFVIEELKRRRISAAPFRDRIVHHALCHVIEPEFEKRFIPTSYANRVGKGTHRAIDKFQYYCRQHKYVLRMDIVKHFASIDHEILMKRLGIVIKDIPTLQLCRLIIDSGKNVHDQDRDYYAYPGDDLLDVCRNVGLPIGNLTSQFWSNCHLHSLDLFVLRELGCKSYIRYVDDFALFSNSKHELWQWRERVATYLETLRLRPHDESQVHSVNNGSPWLGFVIFPNYRRIKGRVARHGIRRVRSRFEAWQKGDVSYAQFDDSVQGWINHVSHGDSFGLRMRVLGQMTWSGKYGRK